MILGWVRQWMNEQAFRRDVVEDQGKLMARIQNLEKHLGTLADNDKRQTESITEAATQINENVKHLRQLYSKVHTHDENPVEEVSGNEVESGVDKQASGNVSP
jgi:archaellum component FlaC